MIPIELTDEELVFLPAYREVVYAEDGQPDASGRPRYIPLPCVVLDGHQGRTISRWQLTPGERARIAAGEDLYLEQYTFNHPLQPIRPTVGLQVACPTERM
jgi:hypothetical protein